MIRKIALATLVAGMLDIMSAFYFAGRAGKSPGDGLRFVGPQLGTNRALLGLATRFTLMAIMASIFAAAAGHLPAPTR